MQHMYNLTHSHAPCAVAFAIEKGEGARGAIVVNSWYNWLQLPTAPTGSAASAAPAAAADVKAAAAGTQSHPRALVSSRALLNEQLARLAPERPLIQVRASRSHWTTSRSLLDY